MYSTLFARDLFSQLDDFQREIQGFFESSPSIRGIGRGAFPALNIGQTPTSVELYVFAPGIDPDSINLDLDRGVLTISGDRATNPWTSDGSGQDSQTEKDNVSTDFSRRIKHMSERFSGRFQRVVSLPDDVDADSVTANYSNGVLHLKAKREESAKPRRITVQ